MCVYIYVQYNTTITYVYKYTDSIFETLTLYMIAKAVPS